MDIPRTSTAAWKLQVWASFAISSALTGLGILYLPVDLWTKGFLAMGMLFTIGSCFSLAKTIRDEHEATGPSRASGHPFRAT